MARKQMIGALGAIGLAAAIAAPAQAASWTPVATGMTEDITAIEYQSADRFWFTTGSGKIFKRVGDAFVPVENDPAVVFRDIEFQDGGNVGLAVGTNGGVYRSTDAGSSWDPVAILLNSHPTNPNDCNEPAVQPLGDADSVNFTGDGTRAWITADGSQIATSAGTNLTVGSPGMWTDANKSGVTCKISGDVDDTFPVAGSSVYFVGKSFGEVFFTANNLGSTASEKAGSAGNGFQATRRLAADPGNPNRQWSVAPNGTGGSYYKRTENGWSGADDWEIANPDAGALTKAHDVDSRGGTVVSVGEGGTILHSIDGRTFFHSPAAGLTEDWHAVSVADGANAAVGGTNGKLVLSTTANVTPDIIKPTGSIGTESDRFLAGSPATFVLNAADTGGSGLNPASYVWSVAGFPNQGGNPATFRFPNPGTYTVKVTFADHAGNVAEATKTVSVVRATSGGGSNPLTSAFEGAGNGASAKIVGKRVRIRARGTVALPAGASCSGRVKLTVKRKKTTLAKRSVKLKSKGGKCRFGKTIHIKRTKVGRTTTRLRLKVAIKRNPALRTAALTKTLVIKK